MIVDVHAHIFPYLGGASGYDSVSTHMMYFQKATADSPAQAVRRIKDNVIVEGQTLWDPEDPRPSGKIEVNFRVGGFGRLEWTKDGIDYRVNLYPPSLQGMTAPPEFMIAQMDYSGVDIVVLQNAWLYGQLNEYFADAVKKYPNRFLGQVQVKEVEAYKEDQINQLRHGVKELGLTGGLYYSDRRFWETGYQDHIDDEKFFPFWEEVRELGIPVFWCLSAVPDPTQPGQSTFARYVAENCRFGNWLSNFPEIPSVLVHGMQISALSTGEGFTKLPEDVWDIWNKPNVYLEVLFPIQVSWPGIGPKQWDYPYPQVQPFIKELYDKLGPEKLLWGSDMPNVERNCTYKQSLDYLLSYCEFITPRHMDLIVGGNAERIFGLNT